MRKIKLLHLILCTLLLVGSVSSQTLFGLKKTVNGSTTIPFDVVSIDAMTGSSAVVLGTNSLIGVATGATTYDQQNRRYICWGFDTQNNQQLYVMDMENLITTSTLFNDQQPIEMEYDLQAQKAYGLWWDGSTEQFGEIDLQTGIVSSISSLPGVDAVAIGNSTFDSNTGTYIFIGVDGNQYKLYSVDAATGSIINSPTIWQNGDSFSALEFNNQSGGKLYGLYQDTDYDNFSQIYQTYYTDLRLVEIDLVSGTSTFIDPLNSVIGGYLPSYAVGGLCFDQGSEIYIVWVQNENGSYLQTVDVSTAALITSTTLTGEDYFYELQVDNSFFANAFYNLSSSNQNIGDNAALANVTLYPNPTSGSLTIASTEKIEQYTIYSSNGALVKQSTDVNDLELQVDFLTPGVYFLELKSPKGSVQKKFVVH